MIDGDKQKRDGKAANKDQQIDYCTVYCVLRTPEHIWTCERAAYLLLIPLRDSFLCIGEWVGRYSVDRWPGCQKDMPRKRLSVFHTHESSCGSSWKKGKAGSCWSVCRWRLRRQAKNSGKSMGVDELLGSSVPFKFVCQPSRSRSQRVQNPHPHPHHCAPATSPQGLMRHAAVSISQAIPSPMSKLQSSPRCWNRRDAGNALGSGIS